MFTLLQHIIRATTTLLWGSGPLKFDNLTRLTFYIVRWQSHTRLYIIIQYIGTCLLRTCLFCTFGPVARVRISGIVLYGTSLGPDGRVFNCQSRSEDACINIFTRDLSESLMYIHIYAVQGRLDSTEHAHYYYYYTVGINIL